MIRSLKKGASDFDEVVAVDGKRREAIKGAREDIKEILDKLDGQELGLAALAEVVDGFLTAYREAGKRQPTRALPEENKRAAGKIMARHRSI
ncbi:MAG: hypothetical protein KJO08_05515 [Gammaproteobacteria bacterium]|nr:hypothetical protein [Gammaproteobacteria bacterium]NNJ84348.1 hypothetical protein [Gammaproteobacteria bacterium]